MQGLEKWVVSERADGEDQEVKAACYLSEIALRTECFVTCCSFIYPHLSYSMTPTKLRVQLMSLSSVDLFRRLLCWSVVQKRPTMLGQKRRTPLGVQRLDHHTNLSFIGHQQATVAECFVHGVNSLVEATCRALFLRESSNAEMTTLAVFNDRHDLDRK